VKIEDIFALWEADSKIDRTELSDESLKIPQLHHKYYKIFTNERLLLRKLEADAKILKLEKYEFYTQGHTKETQEKGWELPARGMILKADLPMYMESDKEIIELNLKIGYQLEKIELLENIIKTISNRGFQIKNAIDWNKFIQGG
jgi:hypothetical protein